jgi:hypothetical protein
MLNACHQINLQRLLRKGKGVRQVPDWIGGDFSLVFSPFKLNDQHPIQSLMEVSTFLAMMLRLLGFLVSRCTTSLCKDKKLDWRVWMALPRDLEACHGFTYRFIT